MLRPGFPCAGDDALVMIRWRRAVWWCAGSSFAGDFQAVRASDTDLHGTVLEAETSADVFVPRVAIDAGIQVSERRGRGVRLCQVKPRGGGVRVPACEGRRAKRTLRGQRAVRAEADSDSDNFVSSFQCCESHVTHCMGILGVHHLHEPLHVIHRIHLRVTLCMMLGSV